MKRLLFAILIFIFGCSSSGYVSVINEQKIKSEKILAFDAPSAPWVYDIQKYLRAKGFKILRWGTTSTLHRRTKSNNVESINKAEARYLVVIDGYAPLDPMHRCFGGGYDFHRLNVDLVDTLTNETLLNINGSGMSEGCPPMSGTIFTDISNAIAGMWE